VDNFVGPLSGPVTPHPAFHAPPAPALAHLRVPHAHSERAKAFGAFYAPEARDAVVKLGDRGASAVAP